LDSDDRERVGRLWDELPYFKRARSRMPQVICHGDANRRNLMLRRGPTGERELVAVDWPKLGIGPVGSELYPLIGSSAFLRELDPANLREWSELAFESHLTGLCEGGWQGIKEMVRLAYTSLSATVYGLLAPFVITNYDPSSETAQANAQRVVGLSAEDFNAGTAALCRFGLDYADEARRLMRKLNLS
jgi:hypothetical protein